MSKNILQDVVPPNRKSIRDISLPHDSRGRESVVLSNRLTDDWPMKYSVDESTDRLPEDERHLRRGGHGPSWMIWTLGALSAGVLVFVLGNYFASAEVTVTLKSKSVTINMPLVAKIDAPKGELSYFPFSLVKEAEVSVPADSVVMAEIKASGKIIVYNNYSSSSQRLINNTRFQTPDGLIYRINQSITIPGKTVVGSKVTPGSVEVTVYADSAGEDYNIGLTDFTIPGFKSNPERFKNFYARSKTEMSGGKVGPVPSVSDEKHKSAKASLEKDLEKQLLDEALKAVPEDSVFWSNAYNVRFETVPTNGKNNKDVIVRERGSLRAYFFKKSEIADSIAKYAVPEFDGSSVSYTDDKGLVFDLKDKNNFSPTSVGPIAFTLKGTTNIVWQFDAPLLKSLLGGKAKDDLEGIVKSGFPGIQEAEVIFRPFWKSSFPDSPSRIKVKVSPSI